MKYLNIAVNLAILVACAATVYSIAAAHTTQPSPTRRAALQKGERLDSLRGHGLQNADRTLVMVIHSECKYCHASLPFYRKLTARLSSGGSFPQVQLMVVTKEDHRSMVHYLESESLSVPHVVTVSDEALREWKIPGTPTLILVDRTALVLGVWFGKLTGDGEAAVESALGLKPA